VYAPGTAAPRAPGRLERSLGVVRDVETIPRYVGLGIPVEGLGLTVELAERRHLRRELQREPALDKPLLLRLVRAQKTFRMLAGRGHVPRNDTASPPGPRAPGGNQNRHLRIGPLKHCGRRRPCGDESHSLRRR